MIFFLLFFLSMPNMLEANSVKIEDSSRAFGGQDSMVLNPYRTRRNEFTQMISLSYSTYTPHNYTVSGMAFEDFYSSTRVPLLSALYSLKWNSVIGSLSLDLGAGFYLNEAHESQIYILPGKLGFTWALDNVFSEPYIVPYLSTGTMLFFYREALPSSSSTTEDETGTSATDSGTIQRNDLTDPATGQRIYSFEGKNINIYMSAGVWFQLDWLDKDGDISSYFERSIENTFIGIGVTRLQPISQDQFDLSGEMFFDVSLKIEF